MSRHQQGLCGRWVGIPSVSPWEGKKKVASGMREENIADRHELDVRNLTDEHLKRRNAKAELRRRKAVLEMNERGLNLSLKAMGMREMRTAAKSQRLQEESSREQIKEEKVRRQLVFDHNAQVKR